MCSNTDAYFDPTVKGTTTTKAEAKAGSKIWKDREYSISSISDELIGSILFQPSHYVNPGTMSISANRNAEAFIALFEEGKGREGGLMKVLEADGWTLKNGWYLEWSNQHKLNKIWSKKINAGETVSFTSTKNRMTFSILIKEGRYSISQVPLYEMA